MVHLCSHNPNLNFIVCVVSTAITFREFKFSELTAATNGFLDSNIVGRGGIATVYKVLHMPSFPFYGLFRLSLVL